ncbi:hypothetical protein CC78DRAFT_570174 [Lojkania enalia]|uniref:CFEM domain-containing protein n=1 Tax=Lojkania enalia TaxID=147567 RepID=A0A9P4K4D6_9PLEO|nr:hypothetical protein CC78DRAFT_570174 [Didymosphaeria enalia]
MRVLISLTALLVSAPLCFATHTALPVVVEELPSCAVECLTDAVRNSPCTFTDQVCICANTQLQRSVEACVTKICTVKEALSVKNVTMSSCGAPVRDKRSEFKTISNTLGVISACCVLLRIIYKLAITVAELGWDDIFILVTLICGVPSTIINSIGTVANGLGTDIWTVPFDNITKFIEFFYVLEVLYFAQVPLLKLSYLFFYQRIFPGKPVRRAILTTVVFDILYGVAFVITGIFQCRPISYYWTSWDGEHEGKCVNINALGWANAAISIALDFWMLAIPLSQLVHLKLAWKKKVGVALMFCVGTLSLFSVTVVSILRLQSLVHFANSRNPTWDQYGVNLWSCVELNVGIICACMPAIRVVLVRFFPRIFGSTKHTSNQYYAKYGSNNRTFGHGAVASSNGVSNNNHGRNLTSITYTKTFEVQHGDTDTVGLVEMDNLSRKAKSRRNSSELSY